MTDHVAVIDAMYAAYFERNIAEALSYCSVDAEYHAVTPAPISGTHSLQVYLSDLLPSALEGMADYAIKSVQRESIDDLVVSRVRTSHGSGVMVFRVVDDQITDVWVINSKGRTTRGFF